MADIGVKSLFIFEVTRPPKELITSIISHKSKIANCGVDYRNCKSLIVSYKNTSEVTFIQAKNKFEVADIVALEEVIFVPEEIFIF